MKKCSCGGSLEKIPTAFMTPEKLYRCECGQYLWKEISSIENYTLISLEEAEKLMR